jgi:RNA polymerase sigma-70 factor (ECF subfamily)
MTVTDADQLVRVAAAGGGTIAATGTRSLDVNAGEETDATLVARVGDGDIGAFGELVNRHQRAVCSVVSRMIDCRDDVDDIVQDVFVTAFRSMPTFRGQAAFSTWLYRIAVNTAIKQMKKMKLRQAASIDDPFNGLAESIESPGGGPETVAERKERSAAIRRAVRELPEKHRVVVVLHYFENMSCSDIADIVGCSVGTVWSRLHYACRSLQGRLDWL